MAQDRREKNLWANYRLRPDQYDALLAAQDNRCASCRQAFTETPCVDHDHDCCPGYTTCGKCIRGLLCRVCNWLEGRYQRNREQYVAIIAYSARPPVEVPPPQTGQRPNRRFTDDEVRQMRQMYAAGDITQREIAVWFGTDQGTVSNIVTGTKIYR